jgi:hypothetical protein
MNKKTLRTNQMNMTMAAQRTIGRHGNADAEER